MPTPDPLLASAMAAHQAGRLKEAARGYERVLRKRPKDPDALHFCGLLHFHRGQGVKAVQLIMRSLEHAPANPHAWNNLGNILSMQEKVAEAKEAYRRVTALAPGMAEAWYNLGICLRDEGSFDAAATHFQTALERQPNFLRGYETLGRLLYRLGKFHEAADVYRRWLQLEPEHPVARHMAAATSGTHAPARADDKYVSDLFDRFAPGFDHNLRGLGYRAPELVSAALGEYVAVANSLDVLDAGCGTGLCGPLLRPFCRRLVGVDLSKNMIDLARQRGYEELVVEELCAFMRSRPGEFDAVVSADTLVYFGALEEACAAAKRTLRGAGWFIFTVEALLDAGDEPHKLQVHGRYTHREAYVRKVLGDGGFTILQVRRETLRMERLQEVAGYLVIARVDAAR